MVFKATKLLGVSALAFAASAASAQEVQVPEVATAAPESSPATPPNESGDIVVTGTRVNRTGFQAPSPTTVVGSADLERSGRTNVADLLNTLPQFRGTTSPGTNNVLRDAGSNFVDLRGLGTVRTLVLVNGQRFVPSNQTGRVDLNLIPSIMIDRAEVVTGGASAAYGSDAVAGVVNLILKKNVEGIQGEAQYGISQQGDNRELNLGLLYGTSFAGGRGHFLIGGQYVDNNGVGAQTSRDWGSRSYYIIPNPLFAPGNGQPSRLFLPDVRASNLTPGGLINSPSALRGIQFLEGGAIGPFQYGNPVGPSFMIGGNPFGLADYQLLATPIERGTVSARLSYEVTPNIEATAEFLWARADVQSRGGTTQDPSITVQQDNAFLPQAVRDIMTANGLTSFSMGRSSRDITLDRNVGWFTVDNTTELYRGVLALHGRLGGSWTWDAYYQHGQSENIQRQGNQRIQANWRRAIDAVVDPSTNTIVCRDTLSADPAVRAAAQGCVAFNIFGNFARSDAAAAYVIGTIVNDQHFTQDVAAATIQGEPFSTWAGPVSFAAGLEYRSDRTHSEVDPISLASGFYSGNPKPVVGTSEVKEGFAEVVVPLAEGLRFAHSLELNGAVRYTDYSLSGSVTSWKVGLTFAPIEDIRFRFTRSHDIRAPNLNELFNPSFNVVQPIVDPVNTAFQPLVVINSGGNQNLRPEFANTLTAGVVVQPSFIPGLRTAVDFYDIKIDGVIATLTAQDTVNRCVAGNQALCALVTRNGAGTITNIATNFQNLSSLTARGVDMELFYRLPLSRIGAGSSGNLSFRLLATYVDKLVINDGVTSINLAGETGGQRPGGVPHWSGLAYVTYDNGPLSLGVQARYVGSGKLDALGTPANINNNSVGSRTYFQLSASYDLLSNDSGHRLQLFGVADNLFDRDPPAAPNAFQAQTNAALFDVIGRTFRAGVRFRY